MNATALIEHNLLREAGNFGQPFVRCGLLLFAQFAIAPVYDLCTDNLDMEAVAERYLLMLQARGLVTGTLIKGGCPKFWQTTLLGNAAYRVMPPAHENGLRARLEYLKDVARRGWRTRPQSFLEWRWERYADHLRNEQRKR